MSEIDDRIKHLELKVERLSQTIARKEKYIAYQTELQEFYEAQIYRIIKST